MTAAGATESDSRRVGYASGADRRAENMINSKNFRMRKASPRTILILAGVALIAVFALRAFFTSPNTHTSVGHSDVPPVTVATAETRDMPVYVQAIGTVMANATVQVKSRIDGQIVAANFKEGQLVHKGDLLFQIDRAPYEAALRVAEGNLQRDQAQLANARLDLSRATALVKKGYVSVQTRDAAVAASKGLVGTVASDMAAVDQARLQLGYTEIRSPIDGKTGAILVDVGNLIKANDTGALVVITQIQPVKISFSLAQQNLPKLQERAAQNALVASLKAHGDTGAEVTAPVDFIGNAVNATAGTIELRATYDNPDYRLVPGEFVDVRVELDNLKNSITVPRDAVNTGQNGLYVYVVNADKKAEMRTVSLLYQNDTTAALSGDVKPGDQVITDGQLRVSPGNPVKVVTRAPVTS
jgi:multidrug efflux system membrane fusion protein